MKTESVERKDNTPELRQVLDKFADVESSLNVPAHSQYESLCPQAALQAEMETKGAQQVATGDTRLRLYGVSSREKSVKVAQDLESNFRLVGSEVPIPKDLLQRLDWATLTDGHQESHPSEQDQEDQLIIRPAPHTETLKLGPIAANQKWLEEVESIARAPLRLENLKQTAETQKGLLEEKGEIRKLFLMDFSI